MQEESDDATDCCKLWLDPLTPQDCAGVYGRQRKQKLDASSYEFEEILREYCTTRPTVCLKGPSARSSSSAAFTSFSLGRSSQTMIADVRVARRHAYFRIHNTVSLENGTNETTAMLIKTQHDTYLNGSLLQGEYHPLQNDDIVALGRNTRGKFLYPYRVRLVDTSGPKSAGKKRKARLNPCNPPVPEPDDQQVEEASVVTENEAHPAAEELQCPVCLDILVQAQSLVPCGHVFCKSCVKEKCPTCREKVKLTVPNRTVDQTIAKIIASEQSFFDEGDKEHYKSRVGMSNTTQGDSDTAKATTCKSNKRVRRQPSRKNRSVSGGSAALAIYVE